MNVRELIRHLSDLPGDTDVLLGDAAPLVNVTHFHSGLPGTSPPRSMVVLREDGPPGFWGTDPSVLSPPIRDTLEAMDGTTRTIEYPAAPLPVPLETRVQVIERLIVEFSKLIVVSREQVMATGEPAPGAIMALEELKARHPDV